MSTLTSTQMNIKRSSTRVHGPPGGVSQLTFGPGGFGTGVAQELDAENRDMVQPRHDFLPQKPTMMQPQQTPSNNQQHSYQNYSRPPPTGYAPPPTGYAPPSTAASSAYGPPPTAKPPQSAYAPNVYIHQSGGPERPQTTGWGRGASAASQPPLTSSKRDQNWEKKRRQWLMRKGGGTPNYSTTPFTPTPSSNNYSTPFTPTNSNNYGTSFPSSNNYGNPPSPLSKLMNNVTIDSTSRPQFQCNNPPLHQQFNQQPQNYQAPPPTGYNRGIPPSSSGTTMYTNRGGTPSSTIENNFQTKPNVFQQSGAGQFSQYPNQQRAPNTQSTTRSIRQAPGGTSNWSPYN
ncbi:hypothetical protein THRCLA_00930 [Thraustotheca clavata]|uniref:Uncharacterized protein n=1 Tax=Thraustotheca clavata TaxID=74557 RepID=A0A1W0AA70_9STRA|nr:hypothetical protein THRCLA_00930 [Thraustotheca clavata]